MTLPIHRIERLLIGCALLAMALLPALSGTARAQEASPVAGCTLPATYAKPSLPIPPEPTTAPTPRPANTPATAGSPIAAATAAATAAPAAATPATAPLDDTVTAQLRSTADAWAECLTLSDYAGFSQLVSQRYLGDNYGGGTKMTRDDFVALYTGVTAPTAEITALENARVDSAGNVSAEVSAVIGRQLVHERWTFAFRHTSEDPATPATGGRWIVHITTPLAVDPPAGADVLSVDFSGGKIVLDPKTPVGSDVVLSAMNPTSEDHEVLVLRMDAGVTPDALLDTAGPGLPAGFTWVGQATLPANLGLDLVLVGLEPGSYAIVCLFPDADGIPHLADGEVATFIVRK